MSKAKPKKNELLPFSVIVSASKGDVNSINAVLKYFEKYIVALSTKTLYDEFGNKHLYVDSNVRRRLETKLITKIIKFKVA